MKNLTISKRLGLLVGAAIAVVVLLTAVSLRSGNALADDARLLAAVPDVMRRATLADMYHDATYGSVYRAVTAVDDAALPDIRTEVTDALAGLRSSLVSVSDSGLDPAVEAAVDAVLPAVDAYERTALDVLDRRDAAQPTDTAEAEFVAAFEELEQALPTVADAVQVRIDALSSHAEDTAAALRQEAMIGAGVGIVLFGIIALLISRSIVRPVRRTAEVLDEVAAGDLRSRLDTSGRDELASMARSLNTALDELGSAFGEIVESAQVLASSSEELTATSTQLASAAEETSVQAGYVSSAAGHVAQSVSGLASGTSEMTDSIQDISYNAQDAVVVAGRAMSVADETNSTVIKLGSSSAEIGSVVQTITSIAEQTNLLALNATIEAARAGEAGKGFAVVAQEVKELSRATANATADIAERITAIQSDAEASVAAIARITEIIARVGETQSSIASAVEQQTATTDQLSRNIGEVSAGSNEIAENIDGMARTATDLSAGAHQTRSTAVELSAMALQLHQLASRYRR